VRKIRVNLFEMLLMIIFFSLIAFRLLRKRKEIKVEKILIFEYSKEYTEKINEIASKHQKLMKFAGLLSLISAPILTFVGVYYLINSLIYSKMSVALVLPTVSEFKYPGPVISVPFWIWIVAIFLIIFSHESMHALIASTEGVKTRRYGIIYLLIVPIGAFVDLSEKKLEKLEPKKKIKIFAAGSFGNLILFLVFTILLFLIIQLTNITFESKGVWFNNTIPESPAEKVGLKGIITQINNKTINNIYDLQDFLKNTKPYSTVTIKTTEGIFNITLAEKDNASYIGIMDVRNYIVYKNTNTPANENLLKLFAYLILVVQWVSFLSLGIAVANMLPIIPLDGGLITKEILKNIFGKKGELASKFISALFIVVVVYSLLSPSLTPRAVS
jgi:membrane-associated protease RseP (regulator of RpoE activity)